MENSEILCSQCGKELKITDKFCTKCGAKNEGYSADAIKESSIITNNNKTPRNRKTFIGIGIAVALLLVLAFVAPTVLALISPNNYVNTAIANTYKAFEKNNNIFNEVPTVASIFSNKDGNTQKELYLKIEDIKAVGLPLDTSILNNYGLKLKMQANKDNTAGNINVAILDDESELVGASFYIDEDKIALEAPKLFKDVLGIKIEAEDSNNSENNNDGLNDLNSVLNNYSELIKSSKELEGIYIDLVSKYITKITDLIKFERDKNDKSLYSATVNGEDIVSILTDFLIELFNNEDFKDYLATSMYLSEGYYPKEYYTDKVENMVLSLPDEIDYALEEIEISDLIVNVEIEKKTMVALDASISITSSGETLKIKYAMDYNIEKDNPSVNFSLKFGVSSYDTIEGSISYNRDGNSLERIMNFDINISEFDGIISFDYTESLIDKKKYESELTCKINNGYEDIQVKYNTEGAYKNKERIDYENISLRVSVDNEPIEVKLSGYAASEKIKAMDKVDKVTFIDDFDEQDFNELYEEINNNLFLIFNSFGGSI